MRIFIAAAACFALAGCTTVGSIDTAISNNLPKLCSAAAVAHTAFVAASVSGKISERTQTRELAAWDALSALCVDPSAHSTAGVLVAAATAYGTIAKALAEAE